MLLKLRHGEHLYEVVVPAGSRVSKSEKGRTMLVIPGPSPEDTSTWLPAPSIVNAARRGEHGLRLRSEWVPAAVC